MAVTASVDPCALAWCSTVCETCNKHKHKPMVFFDLIGNAASLSLPAAVLAVAVTVVVVAPRCVSVPVPVVVAPRCLRISAVARTKSTT